MHVARFLGLLVDRGRHPGESPASLGPRTTLGPAEPRNPSDGGEGIALSRCAYSSSTQLARRGGGEGRGNRPRPNSQAPRPAQRPEDVARHRRGRPAKPRVPLDVAWHDANVTKREVLGPRGRPRAANVTKREVFAARDPAMRERLQQKPRIRIGGGARGHLRPGSGAEKLRVLLHLHQR